MNPEREKSGRPNPGFDGAAVPAAGMAATPIRSGPMGLVPEAYAKAKGLFQQGHVDEALLALRSLFRVTADKQQGGMREAALLKAWCLIEQKKHSQAMVWVEKAQQLGMLSADDLGAQIIEQHVELFAERYVSVQQAAQDLLLCVKSPADPDHAELRLLLGASLRWQGHLQEAVSHLEHAYSVFTALEEEGRRASAANFLGWTLLSMGRLDDSRRWFAKSLTINRKLEATRRVAQNLQNLAIVSYKQGSWQQATSFLQEELDLISGENDMVCRARIALGNVQRQQGELLDARSSLMKAYSLAAENGLGREETLALEFMGDVFRDEGNPAEARRYYQRGLALACNLAPRGDLVMELQRREGECLDLEGRHEEAHHLLNEALTLAQEVGDRFETAVVKRCLGVNSANLGRWRVARQFLLQTVATLSEMNARPELMIANYHLGRLLLRQIDTGNAGTFSGRLLEEAWEHAIAADKLSQDLVVTHLNDDIKDLVSGLARRRLHDSAAASPLTAFSLRRAPATRVIAVSESMQQVLRRCDGYSRYDNPVLLSGESGSGKVLLAQRLHENSPRGAQPFIQVSCSQTSVDIFARELFGQAPAVGPKTGKGATGLVAQAGGGTLLLREIGDLPRELQGKILRLIQEGVYRPIGDSRERHCDVRIIATTDIELSHLLVKERFRPDLFFRLRLMSVAVPALRHRSEDIMPLLDHFLTRLEGSTLTARSLFDFQALEVLATHHWPGNAAEIEAVAQQAWLSRNLGRPVSLHRVEGPAGPFLELVDQVEQTRPALAAAKTSGSRSRPLAPRSPAPPGRQGRTGHPSGMTWSSLNAMIQRAGGNKARVARNLGISRITLYRWLKQLDPDTEHC